MKHNTPLLGSRLAIALLMLWTASISGCGQADKQNQNKPKPAQGPASPGKQGVGPVAKELDPKVVEAWRQAGAKVGWYGRAEDGGDRFCETKPNDVAAVPALRWLAFEAGIIVKLPAPSAPFALSLSHTEVADAGLKELAGLASLQTLALHGTQVTDAGLKELAGLKSLQSLEQSQDFQVSCRPVHRQIPYAFSSPFRRESFPSSARSLSLTITSGCHGMLSQCCALIRIRFAGRVHGGSPWGFRRLCP